MPNNTLCVLPFNTLSIGQSGHQRLCCNALNGGLSNSDMPAPVTQRVELIMATQFCITKSTQYYVGWIQASTMRTYAGS